MKSTIEAIETLLKPLDYTSDLNYPPEISIALKQVLKERIRQEIKWGQQNHDPFIYGAILMEEVGEYSQAALQNKFGGPKGESSNVLDEAVQVAAVALANVECLIRRQIQNEG